MKQDEPARLAGHEGVCSSRVTGSPYQPGDVVRVVRLVELDVCTDETVEALEALRGRLGVVKVLDYRPTIGQSFPADPLLLVAFSHGVREVFWTEEVVLRQRSRRAA